MSTSPEPTELKGGHPPAEKIAGGVRIARKEKLHSGSESEVTNVEQKSTSDASSEDQSGNSDELGEIRQTNNVLASSGLAGQTKLDYPESAVRYCHEKPGCQPSHQPPHVQDVKNHHQNHHQFQPRKQ